MLLTNEQLDEVMGFVISEDGFFSEGVVILLDGGAWELVEQCGDQLVFEMSEEIEDAIQNMEFFYDRAL